MHKRDKTSLSLSRVRTYHLLKRAPCCVLGRVEREPNSASPTYWLGKTYEAVGNDEEVLGQFRKASKLRPRKTKYKKALIRTMETVEKDDSDPEDKGKFRAFQFARSPATSLIRDFLTMPQRETIIGASGVRVGTNWQGRRSFCRGWDSIKPLGRSPCLARPGHQLCL